MKTSFFGLLLALAASGCTIHNDRRHSNDDDGYRGTASSAPDHQLVCHKGKKTLSLPPSAVDAHLGHGDRRGAC